MFVICVLPYGQKFNFASQRDKSETTLKEIAIHFLNKIGGRLELSQNILHSRYEYFHNI